MNSVRVDFAPKNISADIKMAEEGLPEVKPDEIEGIIETGKTDEYYNGLFHAAAILDSVPLYVATCKVLKKMGRTHKIPAYCINAAVLMDSGQFIEETLLLESCGYEAEIPSILVEAIKLGSKKVTTAILRYLARDNPKVIPTIRAAVEEL